MRQQHCTRLANNSFVTSKWLTSRNHEKCLVFFSYPVGSCHIIRFPADKGIAGAAVMTGKVVNVPEPYLDPRFNASVDTQTGYRTRNLLAVPLQNMIDGEVVGAFEILNKRTGSFDHEDE